MNYLICTFLTLISFSVVGQVSSSDEKKILKIVGEDFVKLDAKSSYPFGLHPEKCLVDTSKTCVGDTTGLIFNNEYTLFRDFIHFKKEKELFGLMNPKIVTIGEYQEFKDYVRDSIARVNLILKSAEDGDAIEFLKLSKEEKQSKEFRDAMYTDNRAYSPNDHQLNWKHKLSYSNEWHVPILNDLYLPAGERFRGQKEFDDRTLFYRYDQFLPTTKNRSDFASSRDFIRYARGTDSEINFLVPIVNNNDIWAKNAQHNDDQLGILSQLYEKISDAHLLVGLLGTQAQAFCQWKQIQLQKEFNKKSLPFEVKVTLPTPDQLKDYSSDKYHQIPEQNFSDQWRVTKSEYAEFQDYVRDSVTRDILYFHLLEDKEATKFIHHSNRYFDESFLEYVEFDPSDRRLNKDIFALNRKTKIKQSHLNEPKVRRALNQADSSNQLTSYRYETVHTKTRVNEPEYQVGDSSQYNAINERVYDQVYDDYYFIDRKTIEDRDYKNQLGFCSGVRLLDDFNDYQLYECTDVFLEDDLQSGDPNSLIPSLSYEQALAFYNWKYPIDKFNPKKNNWQEYVYPSEEQFRKIQNGESIVVPEHKVEYPTPLFRYVVHIYSKN